MQFLSLFHRLLSLSLCYLKGECRASAMIEERAFVVAVLMRSDTLTNLDGLILCWSALCGAGLSLASDR